VAKVNIKDSYFPPSIFVGKLNIKHSSPPSFHVAKVKSKNLSSSPFILVAEFNNKMFIFLAQLNTKNAVYPLPHVLIVELNTISLLHLELMTHSCGNIFNILKFLLSSHHS